ncbi:TPA_asm: type II toxin-antitoxin system RelE/ParE family toxin [Geoglobus ahangari pleomorphic virus 1]|uniref:Addiction module toxin, RelE/StbE family n=2 Tax=root TaxID=1 RepID=A0A0F7IGM5_9EURY|nr:type II toxin-antitoxin system RelE/ParE family toxin [Geoglobus ahangari]AKG92403.1 addiction module toxin, RelE/StbE family [Geoglobus ahangari]
MTWTIVTKEEFERQFRDLTKKDKPLAERLAKAILKLEENPYLGKPLSYDLSGLRSLRVGKYRIIYEINENERKVILLAVAHRKKSY